MCSARPPTCRGHDRRVQQEWWRPTQFFLFEEGEGHDKVCHLGVVKGIRV
jgi:hypothetical protein